MESNKEIWKPMPGYNGVYMISNRCGLNHGQKGEKNSKSKLSTSQILDIKEMIQSGSTQREIGMKFNVKQAAISKIKLGKTWRHI